MREKLYMKKNDKYTLAIETTSGVCGISISKNDALIYINDLKLGLNHSVTLFTNIINGLKRAKLNINSINKIKVSSGPGSFTGIRIGIATALGLSAYKKIPIEYVDTLDTFCLYANDSCEYILSMIDAKNERVYAALYRNINFKKIIFDFVIDIKTLTMLLNKYFYNKDAMFSLVGDGALVYKSYFISNLKIKYHIMTNSQNFSSVNVLNTKGKISKNPIINYVLASKAEREFSDKSRTREK